MARDLKAPLEPAAVVAAAQVGVVEGRGQDYKGQGKRHQPLLILVGEG